MQPRALHDHVTKLIIKLVITGIPISEMVRDILVGIEDMAIMTIEMGTVMDDDFNAAGRVTIDAVVIMETMGDDTAQHLDAIEIVDAGEQFALSLGSGSVRPVIRHKYHKSDPLPCISGLRTNLRKRPCVY